VHKDAAHEMAFAYYIPAVFISGKVINNRISHYILIACEISKFVFQLYVVKKKWICSTEKEINLMIIFPFCVLQLFVSLKT